MIQRYGDLLPRRILGRAGFEVPAVGMGCAGIGSVEQVSEAEGIATVQLAFERGIDYIDTSPLYGDSERRVGLALEGVPRSTYRLSSKTGTHPDRRGDYSWDGTFWSVENSLKLLKTDRFDLFLVHDPEEIEPVFAPRGALEALEALKRQGVIGAIGLGVRSHAFHVRALESDRFDVILTYNDYHPVRTTALDRLLPLAAARGVGVINGSPLALGLLQGLHPSEISPVVTRRHDRRDIDAAARLFAWCRDREISIPALAFQFCLRQPLVHTTLSGAKNREELHINLRGAVTPLPESIWAELEALKLTDGQV